MTVVVVVVVVGMGMVLPPRALRKAATLKHRLPKGPQKQVVLGLLLTPIPPHPCCYRTPCCATAAHHASQKKVPARGEGQGQDHHPKLQGYVDGVHYITHGVRVPQVDDSP